MPITTPTVHQFARDRPRAAPRTLARERRRTMEGPRDDRFKDDPESFGYTDDGAEWPEVLPVRRGGLCWCSQRLTEH